MASNWTDSGISDALRRLARRANDPRLKPWMWAGPLERAAEAAGRPLEEVAMLRVWCGNALEECAKRAEDDLRRLVDDDGAGARGRLTQLYFDAYAAAVWTDAHARYLVYARDGKGLVPSPSIFTVPCASTEYELTSAIERLVTLCSTTRTRLPKDGNLLIELVKRVTNAGNRGWADTFERALAHVGLRALIHRVAVACFTGLHPLLRPKDRPSWAERQRILVVVAEGPSWRSEARGCALYLKEALRRYVAMLVGVTLPTASVLLNTGRPMGRMVGPPIGRPHGDMETAMACFCRVGRVLDGTRSTAAHFRIVFEAADLHWRAGWVGRELKRWVRHTTATKIAQALWDMAFKADHLSLWLVARAHDTRLARIDSVQHHALRSLNAATELANHLTREEALSVQRLALACPRLRFCDIHALARALHWNDALPRRDLSAMGAKQAIDLVRSLDPKFVACILAFGRVQAALEQCSIVRFGAETRARQEAAVVRRFGRDVAHLGAHATRLHVCRACERVATSVIRPAKQDRLPSNGTSDALTEIGVHACQLHHERNGSAPERLRCAKRPSACRKNAHLHEAASKKKRVEMLALPSETLERELTRCAPRPPARLRHAVTPRARARTGRAPWSPDNGARTPSPRCSKHRKAKCAMRWTW